MAWDGRHKGQLHTLPLRTAAVNCFSCAFLPALVFLTWWLTFCCGVADSADDDNYLSATDMHPGGSVYRWMAVK